MEALSIANLKYTDVNKLQAKIDDYFTARDNEQMPYTYASLAAYLGINRNTLWRYFSKYTSDNTSEDALLDHLACNDNDGLACDEVKSDLSDRDRIKEAICSVVKRACYKVQGQLEDTIMMSKTPAGAIFLAKNYGYSDNQQLNVNTTVTHEVNPDQLEARITELLSKAIPDGSIALKEGDYEVT